MKSALPVFAVVAVFTVFVSACSKDLRNGSDAGDADTDTDADTDSDTDIDTDTGAGTGECGNGEIWDVDCGDECEVCDDGNTTGGDFCGSDCGTSGWHTFYGSPTVDYGRALTVDDDGNIYVMGWSDGSWQGPGGESPLRAYSGSADIFILKLSPSGAYQWHTFYGGEGIDEPYSLAIDDDDLYLTGHSSSSITWSGTGDEEPLHAPSGGFDIFVLKLSSSGEYQWHTFYGSSSGGEVGNSVAVDGSGSIYVVGETCDLWFGPSGEYPVHGYFSGIDLFVLKLDSNGAYCWHTIHGSDFDESPASVAVDGSGNIYLTGSSDDSWVDTPSPLHEHSVGENHADVFALKLNSNGSYQWHTFYGEESYFEVGSSISVNGSGDLRMIGRSQGPWNGPGGESPLHAYSGNYDSFVLDLSPSGEYQWHTFYGSAATETGASGAADESGIYVTGFSESSWNGPGGESPLHAQSGYEDLYVLKLDPNGEYLWHTFYGPSTLFYYEFSLAVDENGNVYVTSSTTNSWNGPSGEDPLHEYSGDADLVVLKLAQ